MFGRYLPGRVPLKDSRGGEVSQAQLDRLIELRNSMILFGFWRSLRFRRLLNLKKRLDGRLRKLFQIHAEGIIAVRQKGRILRDELGVVETGCAANRIEDIGRQYHVQHFLDDNA